MNELIEEHLIEQGPNTQLKLAWMDLKDSLSKWKLWCYLGGNDIKMRYRGSIIGPFWITLSMAIFVFAFSLVYSRLFHQPLEEYVPFFTAGYLVWVLISSVLMDSCNIFVEAASFITEIKLPYTMYIFRLAWRHVIIFFHNAVVVLLVIVYFKVPIHWEIVLIFPGLLLVLLNLTSIGLILSILGTKYRDISQLIVSFMQVVFFVTPISWSPALLNNSSIIRYNPLNYFVDLIRSPLLGHAPPRITWQVSIVISFLVFSGAFALFARLRRNVPFWL